MTFIGEDAALALARKEIGRPDLLGDGLFAPWATASLGRPVLVRTVLKQHSYWVVPVVLQGRAAGFVRILGDGTVAAVGVFYRSLDGIRDAPSTVTGLTADQARRMVAEHIRGEQGETAAAPVYVHDGPPGREAWMFEVLREGSPVRWIFVTAAFVYVRPAGAMRAEDLE